MKAMRCFPFTLLLNCEGEERGLLGNEEKQGGCVG